MLTKLTSRQRVIWTKAFLHSAQFLNLIRERPWWLRTISAINIDVIHIISLNSKSHWDKNALRKLHLKLSLLLIEPTIDNNFMDPGTSSFEWTNMKDSKTGCGCKLLCWFFRRVAISCVFRSILPVHFALWDFKGRDFPCNPWLLRSLLANWQGWKVTYIYFPWDREECYKELFVDYFIPISKERNRVVLNWTLETWKWVKAKKIEYWLAKQKKETTLSQGLLASTTKYNFFEQCF